MPIFVIVAESFDDIQAEFFGAYLSAEEAEAACDKLNAKCEEDVYGYIETKLHIDWDKMMHAIYQGQRGE